LREIWKKRKNAKKDYFQTGRDDDDQFVESDLLEGDQRQTFPDQGQTNTDQGEEESSVDREVSTVRAKKIDRSSTNQIINKST
jgi:hypothetical protein